jgi:hypothetical protein
MLSACATPGPSQPPTLRDTAKSVFPSIGVLL